MGLIINYDLDSNHTAVKDVMKTKGYQDFFEYTQTVNGKSVKKRIDLPNTTLYHDSKTSVDSREDLKEVAKANDAKVLYIFALKFTPDESEWASYNLSI